MLPRTIIPSQRDPHIVELIAQIRFLRDQGESEELAMLRARLKALCKAAPVVKPMAL